MFQTNINIFLQSFSSEPLTFAMKVVTAIGYEEFFFAFLIAIASGVNFRKGFLLMQILMVTGLINQFFKEFFALPRPWFVDSNLDTFGKNVSTTFTSMRADSFWSGLSQEVIEKYRMLKPDTYGLPSGHTSTAVALWGSVAILFSKKWVQFICLSLIILIPLSRLYLARHFFADVLAGYALGFIMLVLFYFIIFRKERLNAFIGKVKFDLTFSTSQLLIYAYLFGLPIFAAPFVGPETVELAGFLLGLNLAYVLISYQKYPADSGAITKRVLRVLITLLIFVITGIIITLTIDSFWDDNLQVALFIRGFLIIFIGIYTGYRLNKKFGLMTA